MHRSEEFLLRQAAGLTVIVPVGPAAVRFPGMISVNATGEFLWNALAAEQSLDSLVDALTAEYAVEREQAQRHVRTFLATLTRAGALEGWA